MSRKRHILNLVGAPVGGIRKHIHLIIDGLPESDFIQSYAYSNQDQDATFKSEIKVLDKKLKHHFGLPIVKKPSFSDAYNVWQLIKYVKKYKVDVIHGHGSKGGMYARIVAKLTGTRAVYTPHGGVAHNMFGKVESWVYKAVEHILSRYTDTFVFESNYSKNQFFTYLAIKQMNAVVNYSGLAKQDFITSKEESLITSGGYHFGIFAMLREEKGQTVAIKAFAQLAKENSYLHLFGEGKQRDELKALCKSLNVNSNVIFHGEVTDARSAMLTMSCIVIPSLFESFGFVALEAMALKRPIISSRVGGLVEALDDSRADLFAVGDVGRLASLMRKKSEGNDREHVKKAYDYCLTHFSENKMIENLIKVYG